ncbi:MAG TPA: hypothetical protein VN455_04030 [Methanotrichaceae archaeon]|nr:hypothetical protein [Methanotrichaceae archaeon]
MSDNTLYELLGIPRGRAEEIARAVRASFSKSKDPSEWMNEMVSQFGIEPDNAEIFACGWFAGRYAGVSEVFKTVSRELDKVEKEKGCQRPPDDGYA